MFTAIAAGLLSVAVPPPDAPLEPIDVAEVQHQIDMGLVAEPCIVYKLSYQMMIQLIGDPALTVEFIDAYAVRMFEVDRGASARMTAEARQLYTDHLHQCARVP
jgi:hypothetical protein